LDDESHDVEEPGEDDWETDADDDEVFDDPSDR
jgi:hypothetical protein